MNGYARLPTEEEFQQAKEQTPVSEEFYEPCGIDLLGAGEREIDLSAVLAGERWLSRKTPCLVVAPSGHGKSSFSIQLAIEWACARVSFGIHPSGAHRILIVQAEDDDNDVTEFCQCARRLNLSASERELVRKNTHIEWVNDVAGTRFLERLKAIIKKRGPFDLVIINPLGSYLDGEAKDPVSILNFRLGLTKILEEFNCAALIVHHTPKTNFMKTDSYEWWDWMYSAAGDAGLVNWVRSCLVIWPTSVIGTYRFIAAKRGQRIGWSEKEFFFSHSVQNGIFLWIASSEKQIKAAAQSDKDRGNVQTKAKQVEEILSLIPALEPISQAELFEKASCNEKRIRQVLAFLVSEEQIFERKISRNHAKSAKGYSKHLPGDEQ